MSSSPEPSRAADGARGRWALPTGRVSRWAAVLAAFVLACAVIGVGLTLAYGPVGTAIAVFLGLGLTVPVAVWGPLPRGADAGEPTSTVPVLRRGEGA